MADTNINSLQKVTSADETKSLITFVNSSANTGNTMSVKDFKTQLMQLGEGRYGHNRFRGKNLGSSFTSEQSANIKNGMFQDLYVGDYWVINNVTWRIGAIDPALNCGDTQLTTHHVLILPDLQLYTHQMNETNTTEDGYANAYGRTTGLADATNQFVSAFGDEHIISYRDYLSNAVASGQSSAGAWNDCRVELLSEMMMYGAVIRGRTQFDVGIFNTQLPLFAQCPEFIHNRQTSWLRSVASGALFAIVDAYGGAVAFGASNTGGIRPFALLS